MDAVLSELQQFAGELNPEGRGYIQEAEHRLRNLNRGHTYLSGITPVLQDLRSFMQTSKELFDDGDRHLASKEILEYIETLETITGSFDEQWHTAQQRRRDKDRPGMLAEPQVVGTRRQLQDDNVTVIGSSVDITALVDRLDWSTLYS